jgi:hypothetical protein
MRPFETRYRGVAKENKRFHHSKTMYEITVLFRPVGTKELALIRASGFTKFPPRLPEQPIFYPVLKEGYAIQIARDWNARRNADKKGYVTRFRIKTEYLSQFNIQTVGGSEHQEYWIPADQLDQFNQNIIGEIEVIAEYQGEEEVSITSR